MKNSVVTTHPTAEPITLSEAKSFLKLSASDTSEDTFITSLIEESRIWCEEKTNRSLIKQVRIQYQDEFYPCYRREYSYPAGIELLYGPLLSVSGAYVNSVKYCDDNDTLQTLDPSNYWVDSTSRIPRIVVKTSWPSSKSRPNAVEISYNAGFGESGENVPSIYITAMRLFIAHFFENRVPEITGVTVQQFELGIEKVLDLGRVYQNSF